MFSNRAFFDFEHGINYSIQQIRNALDDSADRPRFVQTVPRRRYRFITAVEVEEPRRVIPAGEERENPYPGLTPFTELDPLDFALASVGLYSLMACSVNQRNQEIGIRMAMGASLPEVLKLVIFQGISVHLPGIRCLSSISYQNLARGGPTDSPGPGIYINPGQLQDCANPGVRRRPFCFQQRQ